MNNMRDILFQGKSVEDDTWMTGYYCAKGYGDCEFPCILPEESDEHIFWGVYPESVGQYTEMNEFVAADESRNAMLFEGDIVEVWSRRRPYSENITIFRDPTSQYDVELYARAVICFKYGEWRLDYDNDYNKSLCKLRGNEQCERTVKSSYCLYSYNCELHNKEWLREHNNKSCNIIKIGNKFDNPELLEG